MQKTLFFVTRFVLGTTLMVVSFGFLLWEMTVLKDINFGKSKTLISMSDVSDNNNLLVGEAETEYDESKLINGVIKTADARPIMIKKYLERYNSPLAPYSNLIFDVSETYKIPYTYIVAIAQQESNLCKKAPEESYNCWGYGINSAGTLRFENYEIAIKSFAEYLKRQYFDKGYDTPEKIMTKYCPHSNGSWAFGVNQFIRELETGDF